MASARSVSTFDWRKTLRQWHWISSAICLVGMLMFAVTGFLLNHAADLTGKAKVTTLTAELPQALRDALGRDAASAKRDEPVPAALSAWVREQWQLDLSGYHAEVSEDEIYVAMPRPGGDAWLRVVLDDGAIEYERSDRGWIAYFNDLHKGRNTGAFWSWFIDLFALACLVFSVTGLLLLQIHASRRPMTWPLAGLGLLAPLLLMLLFIHS